MARRIYSLLLAGAACVGLLLLLITLVPVTEKAAGMMAVDWYEGNGDVLVILGGSMLVAGAGPQATLGYDSYLRAVYAEWFLKKYRFPVVIVSGGEGTAGAIARFLIASGVPTPSLLLESRAHSTYENALFSKAILERQLRLPPNSRIVILTSDYHSWRARRVFEKCGVHVRVVPVPDVIKRSASLPYRPAGFVTIVQELAKDLVYAIERRI